MARPDPHSWLDDSQRRVTHLDWRVRIDPAARVLDAEAHLVLAPATGAASEQLDLDSRELAIDAITDEAGAPLTWTKGAQHPVLGQRLQVTLSPGCRALHIRYRTAPEAAALQWSPELVYSQCQPIHARSLVPLPDSPAARLTVRAELHAPRGQVALLAAPPRQHRDEGDDSVFVYEMVKPIPPYLLALACGRLEAHELSPRSRVWAAPAELGRAVHELAEVERLVAAAESLFGAYPWERFDLLLAPPSFPYGGMENPTLVFLSPTLLVGDRSLMSVVAHELAHAWTGNLVTNASAEHFWLNEGFTVYAERRILEALEGEAAARLHGAVGRRDLERALDAFVTRPELSRLRTHLEAVDPDEALSIVPYEKGYLFLRRLEQALGRPRFDALLRAYLDHFRFSSITTETAMAFFAATCAPALAAAGVDWDTLCDQWLNHSGLPSDTPAWEVAPAPLTLPDAEARAWSPWQWRWYLDGLPRPSSLCAELDARFALGAAANPEVRLAWLGLALASGYAPARAAVEPMLAGGRVKYLKPLYLALARDPATRELAGQLYRRYRAGYHPIARGQIERLLREWRVATHEVNALSLGMRRPGAV